MWLTGGVLFGVLAAVHKGTIIDRGIVGLDADRLRVPDVLHRALPVQVRRHQVGDGAVPRVHTIAEGGARAWLLGLFLPGLTLALLFMAGYVRMTRAFVLESMSEDYIRTAKAKGLSRARCCSSTACEPR